MKKLWKNFYEVLYHFFKMNLIPILFCYISHIIGQEKCNAFTCKMWRKLLLVVVFLYLKLTTTTTKIQIDKISQTYNKINNLNFKNVTIWHHKKIASCTNNAGLISVNYSHTPSPYRDAFRIIATSETEPLVTMVNRQ